MSAADAPASVLAAIAAREPHEPEFSQAVAEVLRSIAPLLEREPRLRDRALLERLVEPERVIQFRVVWTDDAGATHVNRAWRVQHSSALGPYKGGLRFHPGVNLSVLKFLAFEQTLKNALTGLPLGGAKGGADFDPKGRSEAEVMRFCQALVAELWRHIGPDRDVPAGDIGVGAREVDFMAAGYRRLANSTACAFTGKSVAAGGSALRAEATGYGVLYFARHVLERAGLQLQGCRVAISGAGNVARFAAEKALALGARVVTLSDSAGTAWREAGFDASALSVLEELGNRRGRAEALARRCGAEYLAGRRPWGVPADVALPCATQNELDAADARALAGGGALCVVEGANMPCTPEALRVFERAGILFAPGKAANAGGVAVSGFEMSQAALRMSWPRAEVDGRLQAVMADIHAACVRHGSEGGRVEYVRGANVAAFVRVAEAMLAGGAL